MKPHQLIGAPVSLYTGKVRAYLDFKRIPYEEVLSTREVYQNVIIPRTGVRYIPVFITSDDVAIQDSTEILDALEARYPEVPVYPSGPLQRLIALLFEVYGDEWLVIPAMHYRWNMPENREEAVREFGKTSAPRASMEEQHAIGERISKPFAGALPALGITARNAVAIEQSYLSFLADFDRHLAGYPYLLGTRPSIGDFGLFGPLFAHLYRDPFSGRLMKAHAPHVAAWVERMAEPPAERGAFLPDDAVPETLAPLLARMFAEQVPVLLGTAAQVEQWAGSHAGPELPRTIGTQLFQIEGVTERRAVYPYNLWMWQRPWDHFHALSERDRAQVGAWLGRIPRAEEALATPIPRRVRRENNRLVC